MKYINSLLFIFSFTFLNAALLFAQETESSQFVREYEFPARGLFFSFPAEEQGGLTIFAEIFQKTDGVESFVDEDIVIILHDEYGQEIEKINSNHGGQLYAELGTLTIPGAGEYGIEIQRASVVEERLYYGQAEELIGYLEESGITMMVRMESSFMPSSSFSSLAVPSVLDKDGDSDPSKAKPIRDDSIEIATVGGLNSDPWDWWEVRGEFDTAAITVLTTQRGADVIVHIYEPGKLKHEWVRVDNAVTGSEVFEVDSQGGEPVIFRVQPYYHEGIDPNQEFTYTVSSQVKESE